VAPPVVEPDAAEIAARIPIQSTAVGPDRARIAELVAAIAREFRPRRIVLFGSRAYGTPRPDSDIDLMVEQDSPLHRSEQRDRIRRAVPHGQLGVRLDIHVRTPEDVRVGLAEGDFFLEDVFLQGVTLYGAGENGVPDDRDPTEDGLEGGKGGRPRPSQAPRDWLGKGETDFQAARLLRDSAPPLLDQACFSALQAAEKHLKALLQERGIRFGRTHDLLALAGGDTPLLPALAGRGPDLAWLTGLGMLARYPGAEATAEDADRALGLAATVRDEVRAALGLPRG
jgi:predicted nucleotidyltransferase/HEPN domain-containing protein